MTYLCQQSNTPRRLQQLLSGVTSVFEFVQIYFGQAARLLFLGRMRDLVGLTSVVGRAKADMEATLWLSGQFQHIQERLPDKTNEIKVVSTQEESE